MITACDRDYQQQTALWPIQRCRATNILGSSIKASGRSGEGLPQSYPSYGNTVLWIRGMANFVSNFPVLKSTIPRD